MDEKDMKYIKKQYYFSKIIRAEILFTPLLIGLPLIVGSFFIYDWYIRGVVGKCTAYNGELILGIIIIIGNIVFDMPFIKSLRVHSKKKKK
jgi:hypothetical protein